MSTTYCPKCGRTHGGYVRAVGRFRTEGPLGYLADFDGSPLYPTRDAAEQAACERWSAA